jgi:hypothetical protein
MNCNTHPPAGVAHRLAFACLAVALALSFAPAVLAAAPSSAQLHAQWRAAIEKTSRPQQGCFTASYPDTAWTKVACTVAPNRPYVPAHGGGGFTVGNGNDYAAVTTTPISSTVGTFTKIKRLTSETGYGGESNDYSLQINSQFFPSPACAGAADPANCLGWQQFIYSQDYNAFMQYWLINYGYPCPKTGGWMPDSGSCYSNSHAVRVPKQKLQHLKDLKLTGEAVANGNDTLIFSNLNHAYTTSGSDSVVDLAGYWNTSEYNVIGDGGGSQAKFNTGTSITVNIALTDGTAAAPICKRKDGTTGETNNLTLKKCKVLGGSTPSVSFVERN